MRRGRVFIYLALLLTVVVVVVYLLLRNLGGGGGQQAAPTPSTVQLLMVAQNVPQGQVITAEVLTTYELPPDKVNAVLYRADQIGEVVGKIALVTLTPGTPLTTSVIGDRAPEVPGPRWASQIPVGMTLVTIPISRLTSAAYAAQDGAHVNVTACLLIVDVDTSYQSVLPNLFIRVSGTGFPGQNTLPTITMNAEPLSREETYYLAGNLQGRTELEPALQQPMYIIPQEMQRPRLVCQIVMQDVVVIRLGNFDLPEPEVQTVTLPEGAAAPTQQPATTAAQRPDVATLIVSPADSLALNYLIYSGALLTLQPRNPNDNSRIVVDPMTLPYLLNQYNISPPAKTPYATQPRIDLLQQPVLPNDLITTTR